MVSSQKMKAKQLHITKFHFHLYCIGDPKRATQKYLENDGRDLQNKG